jgi:hypothetical protein
LITIENGQMKGLLPAHRHQVLILVIMESKATLAVIVL